MKSIAFLLCVFLQSPLFAQYPDSLNTAKNCTWMSAPEREMILEINRLRSKPSSYLEYIEPLLESAKKTLKEYGKGPRNYSLTTTTSYENGDTIIKVDTGWHYSNEEEVAALQSLADELKALPHLSLLKPDQGIYKAVRNHLKDQLEHKGDVSHTGTDGSMPWDRITKASPQMGFGNENIGGTTGKDTPRGMVLQLLIDSGIPGYGHRHNILDPQWTHVAVGRAEYKGWSWWVQNFGRIKKR